MAVLLFGYAVSKTKGDVSVTMYMACWTWSIYLCEQYMNKLQSYTLHFCRNKFPLPAPSTPVNRISSNVGLATAPAYHAQTQTSFLEPTMLKSCLNTQIFSRQTVKNND